MEIEVIQEGIDAPVVIPEPEPEKPVVQTARRSIRAQRDEIVSKLYIDLKIPRWRIECNEGVLRPYVRYGPVKAVKVEQSLKRRSEATHQQDEASVLIHADLLVGCCIAVYFKLDDDPKTIYPFFINEDGSLPEPVDIYECRWSVKTLGDALGMTDHESSLATNVMRQLYLTDGDLIDASNRVSMWSSEANEEAEENF